MNPRNISIRLLVLSLLTLAVPMLTSEMAGAQNKPSKAAQTPPAAQQAKPKTPAPAAARSSKPAVAVTAPAKASSQAPSRVIQLGSSQPQRPATLPTQKAADDLLYDIQSRGNAIHRQLRDARTRRNTKRVRCLNGTLTQIHTLERGATREVLALRGALILQQDEVARWRMTRVKIMALRAAELSTESSSCGAAVARNVRRTTTTRVRVISRPQLPHYYDMPYWARDKQPRSPIRQSTARAKPAR